MTTIVKLGGSLLTARSLPDCLRRAMTLPGRVVIVTGGGVFADLVRQQQMDWQFDQLAAHRMAILAMQQMALLCQSLKPGLQMCRSVEACLAAGDKAIWLPDWQELDQAGIAASWEITSDSLAAWLAGRLNASRLLLVKAGEVESLASLATLQQQGLLDAAFLRFAEPQHYAISIINHRRFLNAP